MLISISVQNFLVFGRRVEMSLAAERSIKKFYSNVSRAGGIDVLKSACVYGGNNVGKTCMLKAIATVKAVLSDIDCEIPVKYLHRRPRLHAVGALHLGRRRVRLYIFVRLLIAGRPRPRLCVRAPFKVRSR